MHELVKILVKELSFLFTIQHLLPKSDGYNLDLPPPQGLRLPRTELFGLGSSPLHSPMPSRSTRLLYQTCLGES